MQRTIHRDRDPSWPGIDRVAIELRAAALRRAYTREALALLASTLVGLVRALRRPRPSIRRR